MKKNYSILAQYYDRFSHNDCDYDKWSQYLFAVATKHNVSTVADLACGTGKMTTLLSKRGLKVIGVDNSQQMLSVAQSKCRCLFVLQDITKLRLASKVQMAVCVNDGVNYVSPSNLTAFFSSVANNLQSGAPFVFDVSSPYKLTNVLANNVFYVDDKQATLLWTNTLGKDCCTLNLTIFSQQSNGSYLRDDEQHVQYLHTTDDVAKALQNAGFTLVQVTSNYGDQVELDSLRLCYYAVKNK